jgi:ureidoglycolate dehydrogenase (NAD+)
MMVDILCSLLTGMPYGTDISSMYNDPLDQKRYLGHFFLALDISRFTEIDVFTRRLKAMMDTVRHEPALDSEIPVMVAGDPQKQARAARLQSGIPLSPVAWGAFRQLAEQIAFQPLIAWQPPDIDR